MTDAAVDFSSLLCSRLCHDLLSPVGAMNNGLELMADEDDPAMREQVLQLLADSARTSADRLKFFRLAFGAAGGMGDAVGSNEVRAAVEGLARGNARLELGWMVEQATLPKAVAKIMLNLSMIAIEAMVRGGRVDVGAEGNEVVIRAEGPRLAIDKEVRAVLTGEAGEETLSARTSVAWLVRRIAAEHAGRIQLADHEPGVLLLAAALPG